MVVKKCYKCKKNITKKSPGIDCSRCNRIVHGDPVCAKLSNKQLNALRNSSSIEWSCDECQKNVSRRSSFITPNDDSDDEDDEESEPKEQVNISNLNVKQLVADISRELKKTFKAEMGHIESSLNYLSDQQLRSLEQGKLGDTLEVAGLPDTTPGQLKNVLEVLTGKLEVDNADIKSTQWSKGTNERPGLLLIKLNSRTMQHQSITASKAKCITLGQILPEAPNEIINNRIYVREALTKHIKTILYKTKSRLNKSYKFIWCKDGKVFVRKTEESKIHQVRSLEDILRLEKTPVFSTPI
ncbi:unnamed protein product [Pieris macdunnoughi]|uniref:Uncharacterized protein n=1 Tax=Pieris macdunnoughi TaxID=345717 RepID=A0A821YER6_9NEOP|nr:unnamed protein product [Pieris macdunnoughi]